ncbi:MAG: cation:proton antiporter [Vicinamibacterales bacterium]
MKSRLTALVIVVATTALVRRLGGTTEGDAASVGLAVGFALIAAALTGQLIERIRLPRVTGYLLFGMVCGPYVANIISRPMARGLQTITSLAVALIAFVAGLELNLTQIRSTLGVLVRYSLVSVSTVLVGAFLLLTVVWPWLPIAPDVGIVARLALSALLAVLIASLSPTVTLAVIAECRARGAFTDFVMALTILIDFFVIIAFSLVMQPVRWATVESLSTDVGLLARLSWEIFGSFAFGGVVGSLFALYLRSIGREVTIALVGVCVILSTVTRGLHLEPTLSALAAGLVAANVAPPRGVALRDAVERGALPILVVFFAGTGASLQLDALAALGGVTVLLSLTRIGLLVGGSALAARGLPAGDHPGRSPSLWMALVSQAGITLGLGAIVAAEFPTWGQSMWTLVVALVGLHELVGPVLLRTALARVGEIGRQPGASPAAG